MSSWGNNDNAASAPYWAVNAVPKKNPDVNVKYARPSAANVALLYGNTTPDVYVTGETIGLFGIDAQEAAVAENPTGGKFAHAGWNLVTTGSGGRAGRIQTETLVALANMNGDGDAQTYANVAISLALSATSLSINSNTSYANVASVTVTPTLTGNTAATLTYQWQVNSGGSWTNAVNGTPANTHYTGATTTTFGIEPADTTANGYKYRVIVTAADEGVSATSSNVTVSVPV